MKEALLADEPGNEETLSMARLGLLIDLYHYFPIMRKQDKNLSTELFYVLSSNKRGTTL